jgi:hypothetical protein
LVSFAEDFFAADFFAAGLAAVFFLVAIVFVYSSCIPLPYLDTGKQFLLPWRGRGRLAGATYLSTGQWWKNQAFTTPTSEEIQTQIRLR